MKAAFAFAGLVVSAGVLHADEAVRNFGTTNLESAPAISESAAPALVAFHHHRRGCCGSSGSFAAAYGAYSTYSPNVGGAYYGGGYAGLGYAGYGTYYGGLGAPWVYNTPNPYGYYQNGQVWGSSGPTYAGPFPVWNSPSGYYGYRYNGWGSYGWGGWGGTGPAGWGYQGGFYW